MEHTEERNEELSAAPTLAELKKAAGRMSNWRGRLQATEALVELGGEEVAQLLKGMAKNDTVYQVQTAAHRALAKLGVDLEPPVRKTGELIKGTGKILLRIKKSLPAGHDFATFKDKLQHMRTDVYDTYEGDKEAEFDQWLEQKWSALSGR